MNEEPTSTIKKQGMMKRLEMTGQLSRFMVYFSALIPAIVLVILAMLNLGGFISPLVIKTDATSKIILFTWYDFMILAIFVALGVFGIYEAFRIRRVRKIDDRFPDFVRDLAESRRAGMTFTKAIMYSAKGNYGVLTTEIQKIAMQISWGSSVENALNSFAKRVNTKLIRRTISLIIEASRSGGNVADVLDAASRDARELKLLESERRAGMMSYVAVIYVAMFVFLVIIIVLSKSLIPSMVGGIEHQADYNTNVGGNPITQEAVSQLFFTAGMIQGTLMGVVAGVFEEGTMISGIKHAFIMGLITWIILKFIVTGI